MLKDNHNWQIYPGRVKELLSGKKKLEDLKESEIYLDVQQKGIDMKIGVDIATLALKKFVETIVLFSGDSDFVPAAKWLVARVSTSSSTPCWRTWSRNSSNTWMASQDLVRFSIERNSN